MISSFAVFSITNLGSANTSIETRNNQGLPVIYFSSIVQTTNTLSNMIAEFNANYSATYGFTVQLNESDLPYQTQHDTYVSEFNAHSTSPDVIMMEVIWPAEFASAGYILPLDDAFNVSYQSQFLQAPILAATVNGHIYGVPWFHDSAMLYYGSDILSYAFSQGIIPADRPSQT